MSFYKTFEEKLLASVVDELFNNTIGGAENHYEDEGELWRWTEEELINQITKEILATKAPLFLEDSCQALEPKHIRFIGKARVKEIVAHRIGFRLNKEPSISVIR